MANNKIKVEDLPFEIYQSMFLGHPDGMRILDELNRKFYCRTSVPNTNPVDPNAVLVLEGQRQVMLYILDRCVREKE